MDAWRFSGKSAEVKPKMLILFYFILFCIEWKASSERQLLTS
jgi:hypothetical protein